jgi:uncharacterized membrane protein YsdA (DUF1294 family)
LDIFIYYILLINLSSIVMMYVDKQRSIKHKWRVPEKRLFLMAVLLGSLGILCGMYLFRHKTKHVSFVFGVPAILIIQIYLLYNYGLKLL